MMFLSEKLARADRDEVEIPGPGLACCFQRQCPAGFPVRAAVHRQDVGVQLEQPRELVFVGVGMQVHVDLRSLGPFRIVVRQGQVRIAVQLLRRLGLHVRIGPRQFPDAAEIVTAFKTDDAVAAFVEGLGSRKTAHAAADDGDSLSVDHAHVPFA